MSFENYAHLDPCSLAQKLNTDQEKGLAQKSIAKLQQQYGKNELETAQLSAFKIFLRQFKSAFIYLLLAASLITFVLGEKIDSVFILFFVVINVLLGFFQEFKSEKTIKLLQKFTSKRATVIRDGLEITISAQNLVPGDLVSIETGDIVSADLRLIKVNNLLIDESSLTGESVQIRKTDQTLKTAIKDIYQAENIAFSGTTVIEGKALGIVIATAKSSQFGKIAKLTTQVSQTSSFQRQINNFSRFILILTSVTLVIVLAVHLIFKQTLSFFDLSLFSIALAIGVIPEAMPLVATFSLSIGANKLAKKKVIVKRLSAIEDLGGIQILCTDKTGTITENNLTISDIYSTDKDKVLKYALYAATSLDITSTPNNAFDLAILNQVSASAKKQVFKIKKLFEIPFNPDRRRNSVLINQANSNQLIVRGACESIFPYLKNQSKEYHEKLNHWIEKKGNQGERIIAIASKDTSKSTHQVKDEESNLKLIGLIAFIDPIKNTTANAVAKAKKLGVQVKIITGDSAQVAAAVAKNIGLIDNLDQVITGQEFEKLSPLKQKQLAAKTNVFARMSPQQKYNLITLLGQDYEVGFLGEGINDAPALKAAGVSIVVDKASDVAREVADIILLKHNLSVIINGIELGRATYVNVNNYIKATLSANFGNFYAMVYATLAIDYLPMLPIQILLVNLLSDFPMVSIATDKVDIKEISQPRSHSLKDLVLFSTILGLVSSTFDFVMFGIFKNYGAATLQTYWFIGCILTELILIFSIRTRSWIFKTKNAPSFYLLLLTVLATIITIIIPFTKAGTTLFKFITPTFDKITILLIIIILYFICTEIAKKLYYRYLNNNEIVK